MSVSFRALVTASATLTNKFFVYVINTFFTSFIIVISSNFLHLIHRFIYYSIFVIIFVLIDQYDVLLYQLCFQMLCIRPRQIVFLPQQYYGSISQLKNLVEVSNPSIFLPNNVILLSNVSVILSFLSSVELPILIS